MPWNTSEEVRGDCAWKNSTTSELEVQFADQGDMEFYIEGEFDHIWTTQTNPDPDVPPQSHIVRARTQNEYSIPYGDDSYLTGGLVKTSKTYEISVKPYTPLK